MIEQVIKEFSEANAQLIRSNWGSSGAKITALIKRYANVDDAFDETLFNQFWATYPKSRRKVNRLGCLRIWKKGDLNQDISFILNALNECKSWNDWKKDGGAYIPMPSVWLNQRRWEQDLPESDTSDIFAGAR